MTRLIPILILSGVLWIGAPADAEARESRVASYPMAKAWPTAVRFLRIDLGYKIVERDPDAGYVIFEIEKDETKLRGSLELVTTKDYAERDSVKLILEIKDRPDYEEAWVLEKMIERMREDLGQPVDKQDEPTSPGDEGGEGGEGDDKKPKDSANSKGETDKKD